MKRLIGYAVAIAGIVVMAMGFNVFSLKIAFLEGVASNYIAGAGIVLIIAGVAIALMSGGSSSSVSQSKEEVPIYEGTGKHRKIVGYRKD
ncbi:hypothetical protein HN935_03540 [archaeon]|nr:hypothetical protein [archaeon]